MLNLSKLIIFWCVTGVFLLFAGWEGRTVYQGYLDSIEMKQMEKLAALALAAEQRIAAGFEQKLLELKLNVKSVHTVEKQIITRPVYTDVCIDDSGLQLIKAYAEGKSHAAEFTGTLP